MDNLGKPLTVIRSPANGSQIDRPEEADVELLRGLPKTHSLWLAYQNELGGPYIIQATTCSIVDRIADCGPLYVGHDERDRSAFKLLLILADKQATFALDEYGREVSRGAGGNFWRTELPSGIQFVSTVRHVVLKTT